MAAKANSATRVIPSLSVRLPKDDISPALRWGTRLRRRDDVDKHNSLRTENVIDRTGRVGDESLRLLVTDRDLKGT